MKIINSRIFKLLIMLLLVGFLLGIISFIISDKKSINSDVINYISLIKNGNFNKILGLYNSIKSNIKYSFYIWIFGILFILCFINLFLIVYKGISLGFMISSIIYTFKIKGVILSLILLLNNVLNIFVFILLSYYSINFAIKSFNTYRNNRYVNYKDFFTKYIYLYLIFIVVLILSSLLEIYISSNLIKFVV